MATTIRRVDYFHTLVQNQPGEAFKVLSALANQGVNLLAFTAVPVGDTRTQLTLFPESTSALQAAAAKSGMTLEGPHRALMVQGDDELGALAGVHEQLYEAGVNVFASSGVSDGRGSYGYVIHVRPDEYERAARALEL
jgi:hypothetical protein